MKAFLDIWSMYQWDPTLFDNFVVPDVIDTEILFPNILMECAELELRFPDPAFMKQAIGWWSQRRLNIWQELANTLKYEYDPIYNFDRKEEWTETIDRDQTNSLSNTHSDTESVNTSTTGKTTTDNEHSDTTNDSRTQDGEENTTTATDNTSTLARAAFNTDQLTNAESTTEDGKQTVDSESSTTSTGKTTQTGDFTTTENLTHDEDIDRSTSGQFKNTGAENEDTTHTHKGRMYGNIGVTTTQQLIEAQRELVQFDLAGFIKDDFQQEFCLLVY